MMSLVRSMKCARASAIRALVLAMMLVAAGGVSVSSARAQSSSIRIREAELARRGKQNKPSGMRPGTPHRGNATLERNSISAVKVKVPKKFAIHDLITIIIREQKKYESDGELENKKRLTLKATVNAFLKIDDGLLGAGTFPNGKPNVDLKYLNNLKNESTKDREDRLTTRVTASIVDIKPNGNLVLEAKARVVFDNEVSVITLTGAVRRQDVTPDNTILSTQIANKDIVVQNSGAVRDGSRRDLLTRILDKIQGL